MNKLLIAQSLPFVDVQVETCFPIKTRYESNNPQQFAIMHDGSICRMVQLLDIQHHIPDIVSIINNLNNSMILQIHKLVDGNDIRIFVTIQKILEYNSLCPSWINVFRNFFNGPLVITKGINRNSYSALNKINRLLPNNILPLSVKKNDVTEFLNKESNNVKCNLGIIRSKKDTFISSISINNIGSMPMLNSLINHKCYLQVVSLIRPGIERERKLKNDSIDKTVLISTLAGRNRCKKEVQVHTITSSDEYIDTLQSGLLYCNSKFVFKADTLEELNNVNSTISSVMYDNNIVPYHHTISGKNEYISSFPGNSLYGEQYHLITQSIAGILTNRMLLL